MALSSTTNTRVDSGSSARERRLVRSASTAASESSKLNALPWPGDDSAASSPPIIETSRREIARPRPVPPNWRVVDVSAWVNGSNSCASCCGAIPMPVSPTCTCSAPAMRTETSPSGVNLIALATGSSTPGAAAARRRAAAPGTESSTNSVSSMPFASACGASIAQTDSASSRGSNGRSSSSSLPASIFEKSSTSLITPSSASPEDTAVAISARCSSVSGVSTSRSSIPITPFRGVRSSWLMLATKSDLAREAARAWASARLRSEMSVAIEPIA